MIGLDERRVEVNGQACRVWELGRGPRVGYLAGLGGLRRPSPFLLRLAEQRRVVVPSIPGFPGLVGTISSTTPQTGLRWCWTCWRELSSRVVT